MRLALAGGTWWLNAAAWKIKTVRSSQFSDPKATQTTKPVLRFNCTRRVPNILLFLTGYPPDGCRYVGES